MAVEAVTENDQGVTVQTTGAEFVCSKQNNSIEAFQRIPSRRKVAVISGVDLTGLRVSGKTADECRLSVAGLKQPITISRDSLLTLPGSANAMTVEIAGAYEPKYLGNEGAHWLLPDEQGGLAAYLLGAGKCEAPPNWKPGWRLRYPVDDSARLLLCVFPPKPCDRAQSFETMLHSFSCAHPYPSDEELTEWRKFGSVLTLHSWIWKGSSDSKFGVEQDNSWTTRKFEPKSEDELRRVARTAHRLKMKVIVYMSPYYQASPGSAGLEAFMKSVGETMKKYELDGVYFDGLYATIPDAYEVTRRVREKIGKEGILYIHSTSLPLQKLYCPFIDCYADYILRGEHLSLTPEYARWFVSCWNLSNSVGTYCYDSGRPDKGKIELLLSVHARLPFWVQDGSWHNIKYHLTEDEKGLLFKEYFPRLEKEKAGTR